MISPNQFTQSMTHCGHGKRVYFTVYVLNMTRLAAGSLTDCDEDLLINSFIYPWSRNIVLLLSHRKALKGRFVPVCMCVSKCACSRVFVWTCLCVCVGVME